MTTFQEKYVPKSLTEKDKKKQTKELKKSIKSYKKKKYHTRKKIKSFKSKPSGHVERAKQIYDIVKMTVNTKLAKKTGCSKKGLNHIIKKGQGAYYSSGSRPNQTAHSWGKARLASAITGGPSSSYDYHILEKECDKTSMALKLAKKQKKNNKQKKKQKGGSYIKPVRSKNKKIKFSDFPDFTPNLTPKEMFELGSFGGTYWRPIYSSITDKKYKNVHKKYPKDWWKNIPEDHLSSSVCDISKNKYKVRVGTSLDFWEKKGWITKYHPYGWVQWYCRFYQGRRNEKEDIRQINRWKGVASENGRFRKWLVTQILKKNGEWNDVDISPKIRQTLQHWGYQLTKKDFENEIKNRNK